MPRPTARLERQLCDIAAVCQQAVQEQRERERGVGYGLDDYSDGRIVGGANLARKILRLLRGDAGGAVAGPSDRRSLVG